MLVASFSSVRPTMGETRTWEDFSKSFGTKPTRFGIVARLYPQLTASYLTEGLKNTFLQGTKGTNQFLAVGDMFFEWNIAVNDIKHVELAAKPIGDGYNGQDICFAFKERYYEKNDIFSTPDGYQFFVTSGPVRKSDDFWEVTARIINDTYNVRIDVDDYNVGDKTKWVGNSFPELSDYGFVKYQSSTNKFRNVLTYHRCDDTMSERYSLTEKMFLNICNENKNDKNKDICIEMTSAEKNLLDNFMYVRNNMLIFSHTNVDKNGKCTLFDNQGRPVYIGDGLIPQIERCASKYIYVLLSTAIFNTVLDQMSSKAENPTGNIFQFIINKILWNQLNLTLGKYLVDHKTDGAHLWSKEGKYIKVGATYNTYEFAGNIVQFRVDTALSREYPDKGFGICLDFTPDSSTGRPAMGMFSLEGQSYLQNSIVGVGGKDGKTGGQVSSPVAGSALVATGYSGLAYFNPYRAFVLRQA